jgi:hypothetical protein
MFDHGQIAVRLRAPLVSDPYSATPTRRDWTAAVPAAIPGMAVDPGTSVETSTVNRDQITTSPTLMWWGDNPPDIAASDRVRIAGVTWEVVGNRSDYRHPMTGWAAGSTWPLRRVEG